MSNKRFDYKEEMEKYPQTMNAIHTMDLLSLAGLLVLLCSLLINNQMIGDILLIIAGCLYSLPIFYKWMRKHSGTGDEEMKVITAYTSKNALLIVVGFFSIVLGSCELVGAVSSYEAQAANASIFDK